MALVLNHLLKGLAALLVTALLAWAVDWMRRHHVEDEGPPASASATRDSRQERIHAGPLRALSILPAAQRGAVRQNLRANVVAFSRWLAGVDDERHAVICLGEDHEEATRSFLAARFFPRVGVDALLLETTEHELEKIMQRMRWRRERVPMLGADISAIIDAVRARNGRVEIAGIEETKRQRVARERAARPASSARRAPKKAPRKPCEPSTPG